MIVFSPPLVIVFRTPLIFFFSKSNFWPKAAGGGRVEHGEEPAHDAEALGPEGLEQGVTDEENLRLVELGRIFCLAV